MGQKLKDVMSTKVEVVRPDETVKQAAVKMEALDIGALPVCDGERLMGMITDRDIAVRAVASGRDPNSTPVREIMTSELAYAFEEQDVDDAVEIMKEREIRRLPIVDRNKRLVGIMALADLALRADEPSGREALEGVSQPPEGARR